MNERVRRRLRNAEEDFNCASVLPRDFRGPIAYHLRQVTAKYLTTICFAAEIDADLKSGLERIWRDISKYIIFPNMTYDLEYYLVMVQRFEWLGRYPVEDFSPSENISAREVDKAFRFVSALCGKVLQILGDAPADGSEDRFLSEMDVRAIRQSILDRKLAIHAGILDALRSVVARGDFPKEARMHLFGSRVDPMKPVSGSDVDILLVGVTDDSIKTKLSKIIHDSLASYNIDLMFLASSDNLPPEGRKMISCAIEITS